MQDLNGENPERTSRHVDLLLSDGNRFNILFSQFIFVIHFILNIATTIAVIWAIHNFGLNKSPDSSVTLVEQNGVNLVHFDKNIVTNKLLVPADQSLNVNRVFHEQILLSSRSSHKQGHDSAASISLNSDHISMQAESFGSSENDPTKEYLFLMPKKLKQLDVQNSLHNIRSIRSLQKSAPFEDQQLEIMSRDKLELSGNLGVNMHAEDVDLSSPVDINIESKEDVLVVQLNDGGSLILPSLPILTSSDNGLSMVDDAVNSVFASPLPQSIDKHQLCLDKLNGLLYQARSSQSCV